MVTTLKGTTTMNAQLKARLYATATVVTLSGLVAAMGAPGKWW
jgi:hypothetical protein